MSLLVHDPVFVFRAEGQKDIKITLVFSFVSSQSRMLEGVKYTHKYMCCETKV